MRYFVVHHRDGWIVAGLHPFMKVCNEPAGPFQGAKRASHTTRSCASYESDGAAGAQGLRYRMHAKYLGIPSS
jgi:hypothetical protein